VVEDALLLDLVGVRRGERGAEDEHDLMLGPDPRTLPAEDVLQHAEQPHVGQGLAQFLAELPVHGVERVLRELHVPAQRPLEQRVVRLRDQQRPVPGPPDDRHRLDDLPLARIRIHRPPITCLPFCYINI
jgi:hypothetical protein